MIVPVVYIDSLFLLNTMMDYLLLLASARLAGEPLRRLRIAVAALLGGGYAVAVFLPGMQVLAGTPCKLAMALLMVVIGLGASRNLLRQIVIFFALSFAFGGGVLAVALLSGTGLQPAKGFLFAGMDIKVVLLTAAICYVTWSVFLRGIGRKRVATGELLNVEIRINEKEISFTALRDTGNALTDPVSGRGIIVLDWETVLPLLESKCTLHRGELVDPAKAVRRLNAGRLRGRWGLIPYRAVGVDCGMLITLRPDWVRVGGGSPKQIQLALSPTPVSPSGRWHGLVAEGM